MPDNNFMFDGNVYSKLFVAMTQHQPYLAPYLFYMHNRARIKYNFQGTIGEQGTGKSYWAIVQGLILDPTFNISMIIYSTINFLDALDELEDRRLRGRYVMWDDAGVGLPSAEWQSISNKVIQLVMQTVRTLHPTIEFTMPDMTYLDAKQRKALTSIIDCRRTVENRTDMRIYTQKRIRIMDQTYHRKFSFRMGVAKVKYGDVRVKHPAMEDLPKIFHDYERIQRKFKFKTRKKLRNLLTGMKEQKLVTDSIDDYSTMSLSDMERRLIAEVYERVYPKSKEYINKSRRIDVNRVMMRHKVSRKIAKHIKKFYDRKLMPEQVKEELAEDY